MAQRPMQYAGLDIGSQTIRLAVGQQADSNAPLEVVGLVDGPAEGMSRGAVTSIEDAVSSIASVVERAERLTGFPVERAVVGISGANMTTQVSRGVIAVARADGEIQEQDVNRVMEAAQAVATPPNYEILHVLPRSFTVDHQGGVKDPIGMTGVRLEVEAQIIHGLSAQVKNLTKCIFRTGVDIDELVYAPLAVGEVVLTKKQRELGVALVGIGAATTSLVVYEEGDVLHTAVLPVGAGHITADIAIGLRTSLDIAERVKIDHGAALAEAVGKREEIDLSLYSEGAGKPMAVSRYQVAEIIEARLEEIFQLVDRELKKVDRSGRLPAGVVLTGGGAKLPQLVELAKLRFRLPASLGHALGFDSALDKLDDPAYAVALGLLRWGAGRRTGGGWNLPGLGGMAGSLGRLKHWFGSLLP